MTGYIKFKFLIIILLCLLPFPLLACWDNDDDIYGNWEDDSIWLDDVFVDFDITDDDNDDWWRTDWNDDNYDNDNDDVDYSDLTDESPMYGDDSEDCVHKEKKQEIGLCMDDGEPLPKHLLPQDYKMNCVATVLEYVRAYIKNTLGLSEEIPFRRVVEEACIESLDKNMKMTGVSADDIITLLESTNFYFSRIDLTDAYGIEQINDCINHNEPVIATIWTEFGQHEVFVVSCCGDDYGIYNPGTGNIEYLESWRLFNVIRVFGVKK